MVNIHFEMSSPNMAKVCIDTGDAVYNKQVEAFIASSLTYFDKSRKYTWAAQYGYDDCKVKFYNSKTHEIAIGLVPRLCGYIQNRFSERKITLSVELRKMFTPPYGQIMEEDLIKYAESLNMYNYTDDFKITPYEHQYKLALMAINKRRCSLLACTSAGKSLSMMLISRYLVDRENRKVLIVVPSTNLVEQLFSDFHNDYGWKEAKEHCTLIHGDSVDKLTKKQLEALKKLSLGEESTLKDITISTWQSLQRKDDSFFKVFTAVLVDEAHSTKGEVLREILGKCINATNFKVGVSGTLPDAKLDSDASECIDAGYIEGGLGPKHDVVRLKDLVAKSILTPVEVKAIFIPYPVNTRPTICSTACNYKSEESIVTGNSSRKDVIDMLIKAGRINTEQNTVILYKFKENLHSMVNFLTEIHPEFKYHVIDGDISVSDRETIRKTMEQGTGNIIVATYGCMKQGVNIKLLHNLVMAEPAKSPYMVMQSIGRIVRPHKNKKLATVYDLVDDASYYTNPKYGGAPMLKLNYMLQHYYIRLGYYAKEDIPIEEQHLDGQYEAKITPDELKSKRKKAADDAGDATEKRKKKPAPYKKKFFR